MMNKRNYIFGTLAILWMILIYSFSARTSDVSTNDSNRIGLLVGKTFISGFSNWEEDRQMNFAKKIDHPIRKTAHATEYAVLGLLITGAFVTSRRKSLAKILIPWAIGTFYAATDEFHQLFVPGRSGQVTDVMIDSSGVICGVLLMVLFLHLFSKQKQHLSVSRTK